MAGDTRERILDAAAHLLVSAGTDGVSTRAVATAAGVQAPTLYRQFGDKQGLLDAVVADGFERYLADKHAMRVSDNPIEDLRRGWDLHVEFGLRHPAFYTLMFGNPRPGHQPPAATEAARMLRAMLSRVAEAGGLRVPVETAANMVHAAGMGVTLTLLATAPTALAVPTAAGPSPGPDRPDSDSGPVRLPALSTQVREAVLAAVLAVGEPPADHSLSATAIALSAALSEDSAQASDHTSRLTVPETALLRQWLGRLAAPPGAFEGGAPDVRPSVHG